MGQRPELGIELGPQLVSGTAPRPAQVQGELPERVDPDVLRLAHDRRSLSCNRKPSIRLAISSPGVSSAKWPVSSRCVSPFGRSRRYGLAPSGGKMTSLLSHTIRVGACYVRMTTTDCGCAGTFAG